MSLNKTLSELRVLAVDDQPIILHMMAGVLNQLGLHHVETAQSAEIALAMLEAGNIDLVLVDIEMDGMNGLELVKRIRCNQTGLSSATPVLVVTSHTEASVLGTAIALDVNGIVAKPAKPEQLVHKISEAINAEFKARPRIGYEVIRTDVVEPLEADELPVGQPQKVTLEHLEEGMVLAAPVTTKEGKIMLNQGIRLNSNTIQRIAEVVALLDDQPMFEVIAD
ncbi:response regulator [Corallincola holothuriorum]|uniref:Response regulator n=1 Tax=Corallincola holothuriorum TaxID=2282215 RepID=A0A368N6G9_9GAMM|nr:response regulator [Corallincola holothuriorum]RCU45740.1 response regulator [Corallincola holothuriorum]